MAQVSYDPRAVVEINAIRAASGRFKWCLGQMVMRHHRIGDDTEVLRNDEYVGMGRLASSLYAVAQVDGLAFIDVVYAVDPQGAVVVVAVDAFDGWTQVAAAAGGNARSRGRARST
jgi:hypothetical protein